MERKVAVVYYLSRNGQLEHPHFIQVPLASSHGLYLRDVLRRLDFLRGKGMATMYSWSSKRSYKNGFVWQDLSDDDLIHPSHGSEYILKGSELLETSGYSADEYKVYKLDRPAGKVSYDIGTQTGEEETFCKRRNSSVSELCREEISPPSSTASSTEAREIIVVSSSKRLSVDGRGEEGDRMVGVDRFGSGRIRVTDALKQLVTCGSKVEVESTKSNRDEVIGRRSMDMGHGERQRLYRDRAVGDESSQGALAHGPCKWGESKA